MYWKLLQKRSGAGRSGTVSVSELALKNLGKNYPNGVKALQGFNLTVADGEFVVFVGPSGCGKSTVLRMIAGLEDITEGELWVGDTLCNHVEPQHRDLAMVFQNYALYPHMTVYDNIAFSMKIRKVSNAEIDLRVRESAALLDIEHLLWRKPGELSGGQKQRVAIGGALVRRPQAFLMDEPLSNLDAKLRNQMRVELARLHQHLKCTIVYVTHDQVEAMTLGQRIVVMKDGVVQQVAPPKELYDCPVNRFVASFIGSPEMNFFDAVVIAEPDRVGLLVEGAFVPAHQQFVSTLVTGEHRLLHMGVRPEHIHLASEKDEMTVPSELLSAHVVAREVYGSEVILHCRCGDVMVALKCDPTCDVRPGSSVSLRIDVARIHLFDCRQGTNILFLQEVSP